MVFPHIALFHESVYCLFNLSISTCTGMLDTSSMSTMWNRHMQSFSSITDPSFLQRGGASWSSTIRMPNYVSRSLFKAWFPALHCAAYWPRRPRTDLAVNWRISVTYSFVYHFGGTAGPTAAWIGNHTPCPLLVTKGSTLQSAALRPSRPRADPTAHWRTSTPPPRLALSYKI